MTQTFVNNEKYLIKTPYGWEDFQGLVKTEDEKSVLTIKTETTSIRLTDEHKLMIGNSPVAANTLTIGDSVETSNGPEEIINIEHGKNNVVYDVFNSESHTILANNIKSHQCDELAFCNPKVAREMWSAIFPTLSCLSPDTYVLGNYGFVKIKHYFQGNEYPGEYFKILNERLYGINESKEILSHGYVSPSSRTNKITTSSGYTIEVTPEHPLYTKEGMIKSDDLKNGDHLRCDLNMNIFGWGKYRGNMIDHKDDYPEYVMMFNKESTICFLKHELFKTRDIGCLHQQKLLLSNLGIISFIIDNQLHIHISSVEQFNDIIGADNIPIVDHPIESTETFFWDEIIGIEESYQNVTYDFTVPETHTFLQNGIMGSNTGGGCIITSTPSDDENLFAEIWRGANDTIDEFGNETDVGKNGFKSLKVKWDEHPERGEDYKMLQIAQYGDEKFRREHELEFISVDETLISPVWLSNNAGIEPIAKSGEIRWYKKLSTDYMYVLAYDPSLGTGRDNAAIVVYEFPTMEQVGEWIHNKSDVPTQLKILKSILDMFEDNGFDEDNIFWSLENNSIGEAPLVLINEIGEDEFFGTFMKEKKKRNAVRRRGGFYTDNSAKMSACNRFKIWIENQKMKVNSKPLFSELKGFVSQGRTYKARPGEHDDIVMATLLVVRMVEIIMKEEDEYLEQLGTTAENLFDDEDDDDDGSIPPMPVL